MYSIEKKSITMRLGHLLSNATAIATAITCYMFQVGNSKIVEYKFRNIIL